MRHRARLFAATLTCAVALVGCGSQPSDQASSSGDSSDGSAGGDPAASDSTAQAESASTSIPDDFPLTSGMGGPDDAIPTSRTGTGLRDLELCGTAPLRGLGVRDRMVADNSGGESADTRELVLLGSPDEAVLVAQAFIDLAGSCDTMSPAGQPGLDISTVVRPSGFGPAPAATLVQTYTFDGAPGEGHTIVHVVPVGAAVLVSSTYGQVPDDRLQEDVDATQTRLRATAAALGMFGEGTTPSSEASPQSAPEIPEDFPLLAGWPADSTAEAGAGNGRQGPARDSDSLEFRACDKPWREPAYDDRLRADWVNAEDYRSRQLTTYQDSDAAVAAVEDLVTQQRACPTDPVGEDGFGTTREVRPVALGDEAWAILERDTFGGSPSIFGGSALVVRIGRAVLAVRHGGHGGYPSGDGALQIDAMGSQATESIATMCVFTRTGC